MPSTQLVLHNNFDLEHRICSPKVADVTEHKTYFPVQMLLQVYTFFAKNFLTFYLDFAGEASVYSGSSNSMKSEETNIDKLTNSFKKSLINYF